MIAGCEDTSSRQEPEPAGPRVLTILAFVLERLVTRNNQFVTGVGCGGGRRWSGKGLEVFHGVRAPVISIPKYLDRIYKYTNCSPACFVVGYIYIDRLVHRHPESLVVSLNVHRLLVTSVMVAAKILDDVERIETLIVFTCPKDRHYNNAFYARVGGVSNAELNRLEIELLFMLDFGLTVSSGVFESYCLHLEKEMMVWNGASQKIERAVIVANAIDDVKEISVEDMQSSSPPSNGVVLA